MATRFVGVESTDPWLPDVVKAKAVQSKIVDAAGNFAATDVEGALAELSDELDDVVATGGGLPAASDAETIAGALTTKAVTPAGLKYERPYVDVRSYGAKGDGTADDTAAIQAAIAATPVGGTIVFPPGIYVTSSTLTFGRVNVDMPTDVSTYIRYTGTGTAVLFDGADHVRVQLRVQRPARQWDTGTDASSIGVVFRNSEKVRATLVVFNFWRGVVLRGDTAGVVHGEFDLKQVADCKTGLFFEVIGGGWVNQNRFYGQIMYTSGASSYANTCMVDMSTAGNGNTFVGVSLEGSAHAKSFKVLGGTNVFLNCRYESNVAGACEFMAASNQNYVFGGYGNLGPSSAIFADAGTYNTIIGAAGARYQVAAANDPYAVHIVAGTGGPTALAVGTANTVTRGEITTNGRFISYTSTGKEADPTPIVELDGVNNTKGLCLGVPGTANVLRLYGVNASFGGIVGSLLWGTNNTHDLGIFGNAPRDICLGRNLRIGGAIDHDGATIGFYNTTPIAKPTVTGAKGSNAALGSLLTQLAALGLITDSTTA